jgi:hypothetical protein
MLLLPTLYASIRQMLMDGRDDVVDARLMLMLGRRGSRPAVRGIAMLKVT